MFSNCLIIILLSFQEFCVASLESVLVFIFCNIIYKTIYRGYEVMDDGNEVECLDLSELPDCYLLPDSSKTARIQALERDVEVLNRQLVESRNQLNTLNTEVLNYRRVHGQVSWLVNQLRYNLRGADRQPLEAILPPPPTLPPLTTASATDSIAVLPVQSSNSSKCAILEKPETESSSSESDAASDVEDGYSEDWETTEETTATESGASVLMVQPASTDANTDANLNVMLANATLRTHISEIFRRWTS